MVLGEEVMSQHTEKAVWLMSGLGSIYFRLRLMVLLVGGSGRD